MLRMARRSAIKARTQTINQLRAVLDTAPDELREPLRSLSAHALVAIAQRWRPGAPTGPLAAARVTLKLLAERWTTLSAELNQLDAQLAPLIAAAAPELLATHGVGADTAAALLVASGDNPERLGSEASFAALCGVSPVDASSGRQHSVRHSPHWPGPQHEEDHPLPQATRRSRHLSSAAPRGNPPNRSARGLTNHRSIKMLTIASTSASSRGTQAAPFSRL